MPTLFSRITQAYFKEWSRIIDSEELYKILYKLESLYEKYTILPSKDKVFKAFTLCPYNELKVVMVGYDPYPQKDVATGVLFGNKVDTETLSPSLQVIKDSLLEDSISYPIKFDPTLESWARQGVLMLNSALTVEAYKTGSHTMLWRPFISKLLQNLSYYYPGIIYVLFGEQAKTFRPYIGTNNTILTSFHPSYFARQNKRMSPEIFQTINKVLKSHNNMQIEWYEKV